MMFKVYNGSREVASSEIATAIIDKMMWGSWVYVDDVGVMWLNYKMALREAARIDLFSMSHLAPLSLPHIVTDFLITGKTNNINELALAVSTLDSDCYFSRMIESLCYSYLTNDITESLKIFEHKYKLTKKQTGFDLHLKALHYISVNSCVSSSIYILKKTRESLKDSEIEPYWSRIVADRIGDGDGFKLKEILV